MIYVAAFFVWMIAGGLALGAMQMVFGAVLDLISRREESTGRPNRLFALWFFSTQILSGLISILLPIVIIYALWNGVGLWPATESGERRTLFHYENTCRLFNQAGDVSGDSPDKAVQLLRECLKHAEQVDHAVLNNNVAGLGDAFRDHLIPAVKTAIEALESRDASKNEQARRMYNRWLEAVGAKTEKLRF